MNIAIFGGAFDPPHRGHKLVADSLIEKGVVDEVWFVPVFKHPWADRYSKRKLAPYEIRVEMLKKMISSSSRELDLKTIYKQKVVHFKEVSFTYDTLKYFQEKHPKHTFSWVMGSEYLTRFDDFLKGHPRLIDFNFYIYPRAGYPVDDKDLKNNMNFLHDMSEVVASSSETKKRLKVGSNISDMVVFEVEKIIAEQKLYILELIII